MGGEEQHPHGCPPHLLPSLSCTPSFQLCFPGDAPPWGGDRLDMSPWMVELLLEAHPSRVSGGHPTGDTCHPSPCPAKPRDTHPWVGRTLPRVLVAMSATFWKASRKATAASTVVLGRRERGGSSAGAGHPGMCLRGGGGGVPHPHPGHSPELGVQLGGLRVEILPDGVGALQGGKGRVRAGAPRPPCTPSPGRANPPFTITERRGSSVAVPGEARLL